MRVDCVNSFPNLLLPEPDVLSFMRPRSTAASKRISSIPTTSAIQRGRVKSLSATQKTAAAADTKLADAKAADESTAADAADVVDRRSVV